MPDETGDEKEKGTVGNAHPTLRKLANGNIQVLTPVVSIIITNTGAVDIMLYKQDGSGVSVKTDEKIDEQKGNVK